MKKLKNIGIYYTVLSLLSFLLYVSLDLHLFLPLIPIGILGVVFLVIYAVLKAINDKESSKFISSKKKLMLLRLSRLLNVLLIILPFLLYGISVWYVSRPYKQVVIIPENYEGLVTIQYNKVDGQPKKWTGGFLGINSSRFIEVDSTGIAKTQFSFHNNAISFIGAKQRYANKGGLKIYYKNDLDNEIIKGADGKHKTYTNAKKNDVSIYFTASDYYPLVIFGVTKPENYYNYFMTNVEKKVLQKKYENDTTYHHELKKKYNK